MSKLSSALTAGAGWPAGVAGIPIPHNRFTHLAIDTARECCPEHLLNHAARTYLFGSLLGRRTGLDINDEMLFIACIMHDIGLTERFAGPLPFEIQGAEAAREALLAADYPATKSEIVWDGIAMHTLALADFKCPEVKLVSAGAGADVAGSGLEGLQREQVEEVVAAFPRLKFKKEFVKLCGSVAARFPNAANRSFMRDIAERTVPDFHPVNICDRIETAPFKE